ncbi:hypothetical protein FJU30_19910 [Affinibrenneria salicis]|uniref:Uncharacterized protein n=1 Tax=Affinibrenneria salicis TaxID=2590031 RepID=A0A5J5FW87_9GAMM|nr:hypothetical protein FJU30_19910 [Affinibrenneria salicis]
MVIHLASWRYFAALTLPPLLSLLLTPPAPSSAGLGALALLTHYFCWRLWLDERLFTQLRDAPSTAVFDAAMQQLWGGKKVRDRPLIQRWAGARRLLRRAMAATVLLWCAWLFTLWPV